MAQTRLAQAAIDPHQHKSRSTHTRAGEDKEEEEDRLYLVVEGEIDYERVYCGLVGRDATLSSEGIGDDQDTSAKTRGATGGEDIPRRTRWS